MDLSGAFQITVPHTGGSLAHTSETHDHAGEVLRHGSPKPYFTADYRLFSFWLRATVTSWQASAHARGLILDHKLGVNLVQIKFHS